MAIALGRAPTEKNRAAVAQAVQRDPEMARPEVFAERLCWALLNANELIYVD